MSKSLHTAALMAALVGIAGDTAPQLMRDSIPNPKRRTPDDVSARQRKRAKKLARRAAKARHELAKESP